MKISPSNALDRHLALGILRLPLGLDYSDKIQDPDLIPVEEDKDKEKKKKRNKKISVVEAPEQLKPEPEKGA